MAVLEFYKKGQGSIARLLALAGCLLLLFWGGWSFWIWLQGFTSLSSSLLEVPTVGLEIDLALIIAVVVVLAGGAGSVWILNRPRLVDLLIETEAEMKKVSWPSRQEAWNSSVIVVVTVVVMMGLLFFYDFALNHIFLLLFGA
ncbi:MAG: preprotein translocase subunit SecE [Planctomycetota bacterium]